MAGHAYPGNVQRMQLSIPYDIDGLEFVMQLD